MLLLTIAFSLARVSLLTQPPDSIVVKLRPLAASSGGMAWVALDTTNRIVHQGATPGLIKIAPFGAPLIFCVERGEGFLELTAQSADNRITASARCTKLVVRGTAIRTEAMRDPRLASTKKPA